MESFLREAGHGVSCPKCHSHDVGVLYFDEKEVDYACNVCNHKWTGPRLVRRSFKNLMTSEEPQNRRSFKCRIGLHDWTEYESVDVGKSNEEQIERHCKRCGKVQIRLAS